MSTAHKKHPYCKKVSKGLTVGSVITEVRFTWSPCFGTRFYQAV